jgi:1-acyl-sn-glycerol-3-phosphate acyltransferase
MLYEFGRTLAKIAIKIYCRDIKINNKEFFDTKEPLLLASNHPNSFLDAIILCTLFDKPVYSLARGDAFSSKSVAKILRSIKMLPVYRASEGVENLDGNYKTFEECIEIFKQNGIILIFSEGRCENEWHLRPLKKGTSRLAIAAWEQNTPVKVLPVGMNYSSFHFFGKNIQINFVTTLTIMGVY